MMETHGELTALLAKVPHVLEKKSTSSTEQHSTFPYYQFSVLAFGLFAEPVALGASLTYSFALVGDLKESSNQAFYAGLLISAYTLAETCMAKRWASLSDRHGRRPVFLLGLAGLAISSLTVGFSRNYWLVLAARTAGGLLNGNSRVIPKMVADMASRSGSGATATSISSLMWYLGHITGCLLGGFAARPAEQYPDYFSHHRVFGRFPYLLPNLIVSYLLLAATVQGVFLLEETTSNILRDADMTPEKQTEPQLTASSPAAEVARNSQTSPPGRSLTRAFYSEEPALIGQKPHFYPRSWSPSPARYHDLSTRSTRLAQIREFEELKTDDGMLTKTPSKPLRSRTILWAIALALLSFHEMAFDSLLPTYVLGEQQESNNRLDLDGGLGQNLSQIGMYLALSDVAVLTVQGFLFPVCATKLGLLTSIILATILCPLVYWIMPFVSLFSNTSVGICLIVALQRILTTTSRSGGLLLLKATVEQPQELSEIHSFTTSACSIARTASPVVVGLICSALGSAAAWWSCALVATLAITELGFICTIKDGRRSDYRRTATADEES